MGFKTVNSLDADVTVAIGGKDKKTGKSNPKQAEGYYLGKREVTGGKFSGGKPSFIYFLQTEAGNLGIWGKTDLNRKMQSVTPGDMIRISHAGMTPTPNGDMHKYKVEVDSDNTIDVSGISPEATHSAGNDEEENDDNTSGYSSDDESEENDEEVTEVPRVAASTSSSAAERKAKLDAILGKNKTKAS